jgi:hypothetical protein
MRRTVLTLALCLFVITTARDAAAQAVRPWTDTGYVNLNVGFESTSGTLNDAVTFSLYGENGTKTVEAAIDSGPLLDFSVGARVWRNVSVGLGFHREHSTGEASATASVPHPVFFNSNRNVALNVDDLERKERAIHIQFGYMIPINDRIDVLAFAGPSFFRLEQDVISDLTFSETAPFTSVTAAPEITTRKQSKTGVNIGADVTYRFYEGARADVGAGAFLRYSGASAEVTIIANDAESDVGGLQIGFGARVRF